ncbi:MAG TPA: ferritin family protein [Anaerolineae bacterium]|nr:ferritin family protein [Anaerolineae bacterium]
MELLDVLTQAMKLETDGRDFYLKLADSLADPDVQQMFTQLADDEVSHFNYIQRQYEALRAGKGWATIPEMAAPETLDVVSVVFPPTKEALKVLPAHPNEEDALLFAMGVEDKSFQLYYNSAQIAQDPEAKKLFMQLAQAEHTHFNILMQRYESRYPYPR